jgi:hypothetical protein
MARAVGVDDRWHQGDHFDICLAKRRLAVAAGAVEITMRQCAAMRSRRRQSGSLGEPEGAVEWLRRYRRRNTGRKDVGMSGDGGTES